MDPASKPEGCANGTQPVLKIGGLKGLGSSSLSPSAK